MCQKISIIDSLSLGMYCQYKLMTNWLFEPVPEEKKHCLIFALLDNPGE